MAPPTLVFGKEELDHILAKVRGPCKLKSLTQNQCDFNGHEYVCIPFKRVFKECLVGKSGQTIRIELTSEATNMDLTVQDFWSSMERIEKK
ncbi:LADA_0B10594g1_1 [Lachancea dasiensis]|uniref:LADA_0B10594g1_1 n=1 Tax=Lachancea dasiensis TaxID=1072105 RepID=A0A1G4IVL6_9SACH|nr:LADA_0B10594g1_1 [Lachancea dasiensis]